MNTALHQFQPMTIGFSLLNANALAEASGLAYHSAEDVQAQAKIWGFPQVRFLDSGTTQGYVMANDRAIIIAFRGTEAKKLKDWATNLHFDQVSIPDGEVHEGFNDAIDRVWEDLFLTVVKFRTQAQTLWITGHSLGGALATLATLRLMNAGQSVQGLYTFGSPRVGDRTYFERFNAAMINRAFRFVNDEDIVPKLPFKAIGYCHVGDKCRFDQSGQLTINPVSHNGLLAQIKEEVEDLLEPQWEILKDHDLGAYQSAIRDNLVRSAVRSRP
jgi:triacylglycerol lipase